MSKADAQDQQAQNSETITLYGQTFEAETEFYKSDPRYLGPRFKDMGYLVQEVFPGADKGNLTGPQICDFLNVLSAKYLQKWELASADIGYALKPIFPDEEHEWRLLDQAGMRLYSRKTEDLKQLLEWLPDMQSEIMAVKEWTMKTQLTAMLYDASLKNCPEHAKDRNFRPYSASWTQDFQ